MVSVMKSPNMMSTTGRMPVMAAPTASPVKPASEMGVSRTRWVPNSSTRPESTLKGVPASATSSPRMQTVGSRRISSASASRMAWANVSSRTSGIDVLIHLVRRWIRRRHRKFHGLLHFGLDFRMPAIEQLRAGEFLRDYPCAQIGDGVPLGLPRLLFQFGAVILAVDVAYVVAVIAIRVAEQERRAAATARVLH